MQPATKHTDVEEPIALFFYRPVGFVIARLLRHTPVSPNAVTLVSAVLGVAAGHLFFYENLPLNLLGIAVWVAAEVADSADGQLARLKGQTSRAGRILDGVGDATRFLSVYGHLALRLHAAGEGWPVFLLAAAAFLSQGAQNSMADYYRNAYLACGVACSSVEFDSREEAWHLYEAARAHGGWWERLLFRFYKGYVARQELFAPQTTRLCRALATLPPGDPTAARAHGYYREHARRLLKYVPWLAWNLRMLIFFALVLAGRPAWFFPITIGPLNLALVAIVYLHERNSRRVLARIGG